MAKWSHGGQAKAAQTRCSRSWAVSRRVGSTMRRLPWTHFGSIGLSQGLLLGRKQGMMRTPPSRWTALIVLPQPGAHRPAAVPGGVVPDQDQRRDPAGGQPVAAPVPKGGGAGADRSPLDEAQPASPRARHRRVGRAPHSRPAPSDRGRRAPPSARPAAAAPHPSTRAAPAGRGSSTRSRPRTPAPSPAAPRPR